MSGVLAIIPARGGSQSIKRKNLAMVGGEPLVVRTIRQAQSARLIDALVVSSEDEVIRSIAEAAGAQVMDRPEEFHYDNTVQEVDRLLRWTVLEYERDREPCSVVVLLYPTSPFRTPEIIDKCVEKVAVGGYDSVLTLYEDHNYLWSADGDIVRPINYEPRRRGPRQLEHWNQLVENKAVYAMTRSLLVDTCCRLGGRIGWVQMAKLESVDIDSEEDLVIANMLVQLSKSTTL